jgi:DNA-directed RNA polymerase subunit RPC12/RpoP
MKPEVISRNKERTTLKCECGNIWEVSTAHSYHALRCKPCGYKIVSASRKKHGSAGKKDKLYETWKDMRKRCNNENGMDYHNYGGRGISVCDRWNDFANFATDMGAHPENGMTLDRIDVNDNYCKENCKWSSRIEQSRNKRTSRFLTINGETKNLIDWCRQYNQYHGLVRYRLAKGMDPLSALTSPKRNHGRNSGASAAT